MVIKFKNKVYGKIGTLSGSPIYREGDSKKLVIFSGRGKERKIIQVARFV